MSESTSSPPRGNGPAGKKAKRRRDILDAALQVFSETGFANARLDDVAARAGVAKGTLYLYFNSKESLFEELLREAIAPLQGRLARIAADPRVTAHEAIGRLLATFKSEILDTDRRALILLMVSEGARFPRLTSFYYREVLGVALPAARMVLKRSAERGELADPALADHPQLIFAPALMAVVWDNLFGEHEKLDVGALFKTHLTLLTGKAAS